MFLTDHQSEDNLQAIKLLVAWCKINTDIESDALCSGAFRDNKTHSPDLFSHLFVVQGYRGMEADYSYFHLAPYLPELLYGDASVNSQGL